MRTRASLIATTAFVLIAVLAIVYRNTPVQGQARPASFAGPVWRLRDRQGLAETDQRAGRAGQVDVGRR